MRFVLLVEGDAEKGAIADFLKRWLDPQLTGPVGIRVVNFQGNSRLTRKIVAKAQDYLDGPDANEIVAVIGLLDLYGLEYPPNLGTAQERYDWAVEDLERQVNRPKFRMFFAVHEFEAWILGQPDVLPRAVREAIPGAALANPERVDFDEPPAKLLNRVYLSRVRKSYKKTTYGKQLFGRLAPDVVAGKCPFLKAMLGEMLRLAREAYPSEPA